MFVCLIIWMESKVLKRCKSAGRLWGDSTNYRKVIRLSCLLLEISFLLTGEFIVCILFNGSLQIYLGTEQSSSVREF